MGGRAWSGDRLGKGRWGEGWRSRLGRASGSGNSCGDSNSGRNNSSTFRRDRGRNWDWDHSGGSANRNWHNSAGLTGRNSGFASRDNRDSRSAGYNHRRSRGGHCSDNDGACAGHGNAEGGSSAGSGDVGHRAGGCGVGVCDNNWGRGNCCNCCCGSDRGVRLANILGAGHCLGNSDAAGAGGNSSNGARSRSESGGSNYVMSAVVHFDQARYIPGQVVVV